MTSSWLFPPRTREVQFDEKWSFVAKKQKDCDPTDPADDHKGDWWDHVAYDPEVNEQSLRARSLKLAAFQKTLKAPPIFGDAKGDLLIIGWGSTKGAIEEAVAAMREQGRKVSSMHIEFLQPLPPGIKEAMSGFKQVITIESNWSDDPADAIIDETNRRYAALAMLLRARYLVDVDCWTEVTGQAIKPSTIRDVISQKLKNRKAA